MNNMLDLNLDKAFTNFILNRVSLRRIHPSILTLMGLLTDFLILFSISNSFIWLSGLFLFIRYCCDCLDGAVARKYNKVSDFGGMLDTVADNTLIYVVTFSYLSIFNIKDHVILSLIPVVLNIFYLWYCKSLVHHYGIKKRGGLLHNIYRWGVNNNIIIYFLIFVGFLIFI